MKHKLESRFPGEILITLDTQITPFFFFFLDTILMAESKEEQKEPLDVQGADLNVQASNGPKREQRVSLCPATPSC